MVGSLLTSEELKTPICTNKNNVKESGKLLILESKANRDEIREEETNIVLYPALNKNGTRINSNNLKSVSYFPFLDV